MYVQFPVHLDLEKLLMPAEKNAVPDGSTSGFKALLRIKASQVKGLQQNACMIAF
jgi:hypothetical protein